MTMVSFISAGLELFRALQWPVLLETKGPIVVCVIQVIKVITRTLSVYIIIFFAHWATFRSLYRPFFLESTNHTTVYVTQRDSFKSGIGLINNLVGIFIETTGTEASMINYTRTKGEEFSLEFY